MELPDPTIKTSTTLAEATANLSDPDPKPVQFAQEGSKVFVVAQNRSDLLDYLNTTSTGNIRAKDVVYPTTSTESKSLVGEQIKTLYKQLPVGIATAAVKQITGSLASYSIQDTSTANYVQVSIHAEASRAPVLDNLRKDVLNYVGSRVFTDTLLEYTATEVGNNVVAALTNKQQKSSSKSSTGKSKTAKQTTSIERSKPKQLRTLQGRFTSLSTLLGIINRNLHDTIHQNMGTGDRKDILNYRTGRFAHSAEVTRLTQGREGMLTAYYTYMKYPYQTFEPGFAQGSPRTRDPKLLISKSIREIAGQQVSNRMRAVLA
jgi:hypothetical protein